MFTFIFLFIGGSLGIYYTLKLKTKITLWETFFYGIFSFLLIIVAIEETALGQWFFNIETPVEWAKINRQERNNSA